MPQKPSQRAWYERNRDRILAAAKARYEANRDAVRAAQATHREAAGLEGRQSTTRYNAAYYLRHQEFLKQRARERHHAQH